MAANIPVVTIAILSFSVIVALLSGLGQQSEIVQALFYSFYLEPKFYEIKQGQLWRVITPIFIHFGILHIGMNAVVMWLLGRLMEPVHGKLLFFIVILITAAVSNTAEYMVSGPLFGGLSGVLYGLVGFVWVLGQFMPSYPLRLDPKFTAFIMVWFIVCWSGVLSHVGVHIANTAHTAGLISGVVLAFILVARRQYN